MQNPRKCHFFRILGHSRGLLRLAALALVASAIPALSGSATAATLSVGPGHTFATPAEALARAKAGDTIEVHPRADQQPYEPVALFVSVPRLTFRGVRGKDGAGPRVALSGKGFEYSGRGRVPRAIIQFLKGADGGRVEGFLLSGAKNTSHNGAGVRVDKANDVTIVDCEIRGNEMGIMSNGDGGGELMKNLVIERCEIHRNGAPEDPGLNHNLYLGGASAHLRFCDVHHSLTGHNVKSRARRTVVEACWIHDSANRELDLVDAGDTERPKADALLLGCVIAKDPKCKGNRGLIHFGQDGGKDHRGTLHIVNCTIVMPFKSPLVELSAPSAKAVIASCLISAGPGKERHQTLIGTRAKGTKAGSTVRRCLLPEAYRKDVEGLDKMDSKAAGAVIFTHKAPSFRAPKRGDYRVRSAHPALRRGGLPLDELRLPEFPTLPLLKLKGPGPPWQFSPDKHGAPAGRERKDGKRPDIGACSLK